MLAGCTALAFAPLVLLKYLGFLVDTCLVALSRVGIVIARPELDWMLPLGISFYTLQAVGYLIDVYAALRRKNGRCKWLCLWHFFANRFRADQPWQKPAGAVPAAPKAAVDNLRDGFLLMIWGYFLKLVIADRAGMFVDTVYNLENGFEGWYLIVATGLFGVQLYCDFSGATTVAMGAAKLLGIDLIDNFNAPYLSRSCSDFGTGGISRCPPGSGIICISPWAGTERVNCANIAMSWLRLRSVAFGTARSGPLWRGGCSTACTMVAGDLLRPLRGGLLRAAGLDTDTLGHKAAQVLCTWLCINLSWVFFRADRLMDSFAILKSIFTADNLYVLFDGSLFACGLERPQFCAAACLPAGFVCSRHMQVPAGHNRQEIARQNWLCQVLVIVFGVLAVLLLGVYGPGFEASNFIYSQF